jgi:branched-chain amino acid transport system substrate-binding protein
MIPLNNLYSGNKKKLLKQKTIKLENQKKTLELSLYPKIPTVEKNGVIVVPVCTSYANTILGKNLFIGLKRYIKNLMSAQKDNHEKINVVIKNNNKKTGYKAKRFIEKNSTQTPLLLGVTDFEALKSIEDLIRDKKIALFFSPDGSDRVRSWNYDNIIFFRPSYKKELATLIKYIKTKIFKNKVAIFCEQSLWGEDLCKILKKLFKNNGIKSLVEATCPQGSVFVKDAVEKINKFNPNVIFCLARPRAVYRFIVTAMNLGMHKSLFLGLSDLYLMQRLLKDSRGVDLIITSVVPNIHDMSLPMVKEYKKDMKGFLTIREDSSFYFEGYINACIFAKTLLDLGKKEITIENILQQMQSYKNENFKGLRLNFNEKEKCLSSSVWVSPGVNKKFISLD